jgi:ppGpp synthetase/RelA/SpoT-type nucleotidyltranferase
MTDLPAVRAEYTAEHPIYERYAEWVEHRLVRALKNSGVLQPEVTGRAKEIPNFLKKAIRYTDPMAQITDKAGVRVILCLIDDVPTVEAAIESTFTVTEHFNKADSLDPDQLGYLGVHFLVTPRSDDLEPENSEFSDRICEIQIHTRAQNAWSSVNHPLVYKPGKDPSPQVLRRINRLIALVELFDSEVSAAREAIMSDPEYRQSAMLQTLEREYWFVAHRDYDPRLSHMILDAVQDAYDPADLDDYRTLITAFMAEHRDYLVEILDNTNEADEPLLFQPEAIAVLERLEHAKERLRHAWDQKLHPALLDSLSEALGRPA